MPGYDLIAVGGGTAGLVTAVGAVSLGLRTALVERNALGGDCLWTGCVPSKALAASAKLAHQMRNAEALGLLGASPAHAFGTVMERMRSARVRVAEHDDPERFRRMGVDVVLDRAELREGRRVAVGERVLEAKHIVLATGASPSVPSIPGLTEAGYLTHATAFDQNELPRRIAILGGGPVGLEFAQIYARLGARVTVLEVLPRLLPREDIEAAELLREILEAEGIRVHVGAEVEQVRSEGGAKRVHVRDAAGAAFDVVADEVFVATGRRPSTSGLGLEDAGVALDGAAVTVDHALRTTAPGVWAAGDVAGGPQFTHVAEYHAKLVLRNALLPFTSKVDYRAIPAVTYVDPEVARVGLTEDEAREGRGDVRVYRSWFSDLDRAIVDGRTEGFVKVVTRSSGRIVGATVVASGANDLILPLVLAMDRRISLPKLARTVYPYPSMSEGIKRAADTYYREKLAGRSGAWLRRIVRWLT